MNKFIIELIKFYLSKFPNKSTKGRHNEREIEHYIEVIYKVLRTGSQWKHINSPLHYTTYHKKFIKWNNHNLFQNVFYIIIKLLKHENILDNDFLKDLYIDSTMIKNIRGVEFLGSNHYDRNRNGNKVSIVVTKNGIPLGMSLSTSNIHDINLVENTLDDIKIKIVGSRLGGDKGYISKKLKDKLQNEKNITLITNLRDNSKELLNDEEKSFLKKRHIVENTFSWLKNNKKLINRYEANALNFEQNWYFSFINLITNKYKDLIFNINTINNIYNLNLL
jgi:transposase